MAAETVPEYKTSLPKLYPLLIPEIIKSGRSFFRINSMAVLTQSTGVPSKEYLVTLSKGDAIRFKYKSLLIDMACDAALRCPSGATTVTLSATVATTSSKILKPLAVIPSSLVSKICMYVLLIIFYFLYAREPYCRMKRHAYEPYDSISCHDDP